MTDNLGLVAKLDLVGEMVSFQENFVGNFQMEKSNVAYQGYWGIRPNVLIWWLDVEKRVNKSHLAWQE